MIACSAAELGARSWTVDAATGGNIPCYGLPNRVAGASPCNSKEGTYLMELLGQIIWELVEYFGEMIWQTMATIPIVAVLLIVGIVIELLFGKRIRNRRSTAWEATDAQIGTTDQAWLAMKLESMRGPRT